MRTKRGQWWLSQVARSLMMLVRVHSRRHSRRLTLRQPLLVEEKLLALELHAHVRWRAHILRSHSVRAR